MEIKTMSKEHYDQAIKDHVTVTMIREYLDACKENDAKPDASWIRFLVGGESK